MGEKKILEEINRVRQDAELVHDADAVTAALDSMAAEVSKQLAERDPVIVCIMNGGILPCAWLIGRLEFPFVLDFVHASRYRGETSGGELMWRAQPQTPLKDRDVLLVDDILDEGVTLSEIRKSCERAGASNVTTAVLVVKRHDRRRTGVVADISGLEVDDRYVFGCGMDYKNYWRNLTEIYAVTEGKG